MIHSRLFLFIPMAVGIGCDVVTTLIGMELGGIEANYIPAWVMETFGIPTWMVFYMLAGVFYTLVVGGMVYSLKKKRPFEISMSILIGLATIPFLAAINNINVIIALS